MTNPITTDAQSAKTPRRRADNATAAERPGTLRGEASLLIQTRQAQRLVYGRRHSADQSGIIGLVRFGILMKRIWNAAMQDDPYADWYLLQVHEALEAGRTLTQALKTHVDTLLADVGGVRITVAHSLKPVRVPLQFANPYGYMGAYVIADFDELVCAVLTARHVGLLPRDEAERMLQRGGRAIRRAFLIPTQWKHCAVSRDDLRQDTARAGTAREVMGTLPQEVLDGTRRSGLAPAIRHVTDGEPGVGSANTSAVGVSTAATVEDDPFTTDES